jgi:hypothetical protein
MKNKTEKKDNKTETDFFDWWDSLELQVMPAEKMPNPMDTKVRKSGSRACIHLP